MAAVALAPELAHDPRVAPQVAARLLVPADAPVDRLVTDAQQALLRERARNLLGAPFLPQQAAYSGHVGDPEMRASIGRHRSTITRELRRNATHHDGDYRAEKAHSYTVARRRRCRRTGRMHRCRDRNRQARTFPDCGESEQQRCILTHKTLQRSVPHGGGNLGAAATADKSRLGSGPHVSAAMHGRGDSMMDRRAFISTFAVGLLTASHAHARA
jgi:hypothetical protein